jgi:7,8-dihydropterin-6-yl-methyl-4-(beta-D-ribofuranosyl)aminobenzene 5'-phosphate synthase
MPAGQSPEVLMRRVSPFAAAGAALVLAGYGLLAQAPAARVVYLYDNTVAVEGTKAHWGFGCLVEAHGHTVLFDTGAQPETLRQNMATLRVDPGRVQAVVFSHEHGDHTVGIDALPAMPGLPVYIGEHFRLPPPASSALARIGAQRVTMQAGASARVFPGIHVTEEIAGQGAYEEALVIDSPAGSVVVVGCAHPGIVAMLRRIAETTKRPIHTVIGGFHLLQTPPDEIRKIVASFRELGIARTGPTHCTGNEAIRLFREAYGDRFIAGGVGTVVEIPRTK